MGRYGCCCCFRKAGENVLADVKSSCCGRGLARWRRACWPAPSQKLADVQSLLHEAGVAENVICFEAHSPLALSAALRSRVEECWHLTEQNEMYEAFIALFRPLLPLLRDCDPSELTPDRCFQIQLLLIHFYRRVVLKDPLLPEELLPAHWAEQTARQLYQSTRESRCAGVCQRER